MKNSKHRVWLVFANYQHEAKERIKYLPALRRKSHSSCNCRRRLCNNRAAVLCSGSWSCTYCHPTGMACEWQRQHLLRVLHRGMLTAAVFQLWLFYGKSCYIVKWGLLILHPFANYSAFRRMLCDRVGSAHTWGALLLRQVKWLGLAGGEFFGTENTSPQTTALQLCKKHSPALRPVSRGHSVVP